VANGDAVDIDKAVAAARAASGWGASAAARYTYLHTHIHTFIHTYLQTYIHTYIHIHRGILLNKFADLIEKNTKELAELETLQTGKPINESTYVDVPFTVRVYRCK